MNDLFRPAPPGSPPEKIPFLVTTSGAPANPGPGAYSTRTDMIKEIPAVRIHNRFQIKEELLNAPYRSIPSTIGTGHKYTFKSRPKELIDSNVPAPDYEPPPFGSDAKSMYVHTKSPELSKDVTPGPGQYSIDTSLKSARRGISFHGPRNRSMSLESVSPGPANYEPRMPLSFRKEPAYSIGVRCPQSAREVTPGPGQYNLGSTMNKKSHGLIHGVTARDRIESTPGPSDYTTEFPVLTRVPKICMHIRPSEKREINDAPYVDTRRPVSESPRYSLRSRFYQPVETTPGVDYAPPPFGKGSQKVAISPRYAAKGEEIGPGPGQYKVGLDIGKEASKFTFHGPHERSVASTCVSPGPAEYSPDTNSMKKRNPITIKGAKYEPKREGSGEYVNLGSTLKGPRYSMKARPGLGVSFG